MNEPGSSHRRQPELPRAGAREGSSSLRITLGNEFGLDDEPTVISNSPPRLLPPLHAGTHPMELGRLLEGERLGYFELEEFIGGGGMGAVFRALDTMLNRIVAVKVLSTDQATDEETQRRFKNEAQSAARLDHENIARVYYVGEDRGVHYIVFEHIEGINLRDLVMRQGPLPCEEAISYAWQISKALIHASERDVVHRDIKPSNVLITPSGRAKLVDMGLARLHKVEHTENDLTASGVTLGTFDYISPEQARDPRTADVRSDLYSLGCTLYFTLTGRPPFPEGTVLQKLLRHQGDEPPDPRESRTDLDPEISRITRKLLAKTPELRYQTPDELIADFQALCDRLGLNVVEAQRPAGTSVEQAALVTPLAPASPWPARFARHAPWIVPLVLLFIAVAVIDRFAARTVPTQFGEAVTPGELPTVGPPEGSAGPASTEPGADDAKSESNSATPGASLPQSKTPVAADAPVEDPAPANKAPSNGELPKATPAGDTVPPKKISTPSAGGPMTKPLETESTATDPPVVPASANAGDTASTPTGESSAGKQPVAIMPQIDAPPKVASAGRNLPKPVTPDVPEKTLAAADVPAGADNTQPTPAAVSGEVGTQLPAAKDIDAQAALERAKAAGGKSPASDPNVPSDEVAAAVGRPMVAPPVAAESVRGTMEPLVVNPANPVGAYASLQAACSAARSGDVIELRFDGPLVSQPIKLANLTLTIRAGRGFLPRVVFQPSPSDSNPALYPRSMLTATGGELTLVGIEWDLALPRDVASENWSLVEVRGGQSLSFERSILTVRNATEVGLAYHQNVAIFDLKSPPGSDMMGLREPVKAKPVNLRLVNCVARGEAVFLRSDQMQSAAVTWTNGLLAISERCFELRADQLAGRERCRLQIDWQHVTAIARRGLLLSANRDDAPYVLETDVTCRDCILVAGADAALVTQQCVHPLAETREMLRWSGERNFYDGFSNFWKIETPALREQAEPQSWDAWTKYWQGRDDGYSIQSQHRSVVWNHLPAADVALHAQVPADYALEATAENPARGAAKNGQDVGFQADALPPLRRATPSPQSP